MKTHHALGWIGVLFSSAMALAALGCDGALSFVLSPPDQCFQQDLIGTGCTTQETVQTICDDFGCNDETVIEEICDDAIVDSFLVCE